LTTSAYKPEDHKTSHQSTCLFAFKAKLNVRGHNTQFSFTALSLIAYEILRFARAKLYITLSNALNKHANNTYAFN